MSAIGSLCKIASVINAPIQGARSTRDSLTQGASSIHVSLTEKLTAAREKASQLRPQFYMPTVSAAIDRASAKIANVFSRQPNGQNLTTPAGIEQMMDRAGV